MTARLPGTAARFRPDTEFALRVTGYLAARMVVGKRYDRERASRELSEARRLAATLAPVATMPELCALLAAVLANGLPAPEPLRALLQSWCRAVTTLSDLPPAGSSAAHSVPAESSPSPKG
ncbi:MAG: hypothetical protein WCF85_18180 [Rhodospirillaceae bacterium]